MNVLYTECFYKQGFTLEAVIDLLNKALMHFSNQYHKLISQETEIKFE
jgi:hypothetical protein